MDFSQAESFDGKSGAELRREWSENFGPFHYVLTAQNDWAESSWDADGVDGRVTSIAIGYRLKSNPGRKTLTIVTTQLRPDSDTESDDTTGLVETVLFNLRSSFGGKIHSTDAPSEVASATLSLDGISTPGLRVRDAARTAIAVVTEQHLVSIMTFEDAPTLDNSVERFNSRRSERGAAL